MDKVFISGNITKDIELKTTNNGKKYTNFTVAVTDAQNVSKFFVCRAWDKTAELMETFLEKGSKVLVEGRLDYYEQETQNGKKKTYYIVADRVEFLSMKKKEEKKSLDFEPDDLPFI